MKTFFAIALLALVSVPAAAQKSKGPDDAPAKNRPSKAAKTDSGDKAAAHALSSTVGLEAQVQKQLDVRNLQVGDEVILKVVKNVKQDGSVVVPKGANLIGRVTEVQEKAKGTASKLGLLFDRVEHGGMSIPITASILSITNTRAAAAAGDSMADLSGSTRTSGSASGSSAGGGLLGGVGSTVGSVAGTATGVLAGAADAVTGTVGNTTSTLGRTIGGLQIVNGASASGSANGSATLSSADRNVRLEKGVTFNLLVNGRASN